MIPTCKERPPEDYSRRENENVFCVPHAIYALRHPHVVSYLTFMIDHHYCDNYGVRLSIPIIKIEPPKKETSFGENINIRDALPDDVDAIILCVFDRYSLKPKKILLPHQIYTKDVLAMAEEAYQGMTYSKMRDLVVAIPSRRKEWIEIARLEGVTFPKKEDDDALD